MFSDMSSRKDVDEIWAQLKAKTAPSNAANVDKLMQILHNGLNCSDSPNSYGATSEGDGKRAACADPAAGRVDGKKDAILVSSDVSAEMLDVSLPRHIAALTDASPHSRRRALEQIKVRRMCDDKS